MKTKIRRGLLFFFLMSLIISCQTQKADSSANGIDIEQIKEEIQAKENAFAEIYNSGQMKKIGYYADDAISFSQNSPPLIGKKEIIDYLKANIDSLSLDNKISFKTSEVFVSNDGEQVVEIGYYKVVNAENLPVNTGYYMTMFEKRDGSYVSVRDMSASDMVRE